MYSHCLGPTGYLRRQKEKYGSDLGRTGSDLSLVDWLRLFTNSSSGWEKGRHYCYYDPVNYQTHLLAAPNDLTFRDSFTNNDLTFPKGRFFLSAHAVSQVHLLVQKAFFVGVTEYYTLYSPKPYTLTLP